MRVGWGIAGFLSLAGVALAVGCNSSVVGPAASADGGSCGSGSTVAGTGLKQCQSCASAAKCTAAEPNDACCTWVATPKDALEDGTGLHRYSAPAGSQPDVACLKGGTTLGLPTNVTLTGYVWLFSSGQDSQGVKVEVFPENHPTAPDGSIAGSAIGSYTTSSSEPIDPTDTTWNTKCPSGCSYRQYTIQNVPTETPLVIRTSDAGGGQWATLYDYNVYFKSSDVQNGTVSYDATAVAGPDLSTVAGTVGETVQNGLGLLAGEVHDCSDVRLYGATVETDQPHQGPMFYFAEDEANPLPSLQAGETSHLGLFRALNLQPNTPIRVTALGLCPSSNTDPSICTPGSIVMLGTYVVQVYPGAVTALALRGRRPWQPS
jgi:hypothetical protein